MQKFLILPIFLILSSSGIVSFSFASVDQEAQEDIRAGCRVGESLVLRFAYDDYICVSPSAAERWVELDMAKIVLESVQTDEKKDPSKFHPDFYGAPPPPPEQIKIPVYDPECRAGYVSVQQIHRENSICIEYSTALSWERLGLAKIVTPIGAIEHNGVPENIKKEIIDEEQIRVEQSEPVLEKQTDESKPISTKGFSLPSYPNQPHINPKLEATNNFWSPPAVHQVNDRIWVAVGYDLANSIMIEGEKGIIIVDTLSTYEKAKEVMKEFRKITDKPVKTIIYTHGHLDHVQGTKAFLEEGDGDVEIIAHDSLLDFYINENSVLGQIASKRSVYATGILLPAEDINLGVFPNIGDSGTIAFVPPTHTFSSTFSLDISGVKMELVHVGGESPDQIFAWLPDDEALLAGDNIYGIFPNIYTIRGAEYRDPMDYVNAIDKMMLLKPKYLIPSHVSPISGTENILDVLISTRDATQYIYDQTIRGMNNGYTADELSHMIKLPSWFEDSPWLTQARGQIPWHVKQIYYGNLGWYQGDPAFLLPISDEERANRFVEGLGGEDKVIKQIRQAIENSEYNWAAELATYVLVTNPENDEAKLLKAHALRVIGERMLSADGRNWALTSALELEGKITIDPTAFSQTSPEQLTELPIEKILNALSTKIDPEKTDNDEFILNVVYSDTGQEFTLHFRNGVLAINSGLSLLNDHTITLDTETFKLLVGGNLDLLSAIESGQIQSDGELDELEFWLGVIDPLTISSQGIRD